MLIEFCAFALMAALTLVRMTAWADAPVYRQNALMNANPFFLGMVLVVFGLFNTTFVGDFFKTSYKLGRPFVAYIVVAFVAIGVAEALHHVPGLGALYAFGFDHIALQGALLACGALLFASMTYLSYKRACDDFERTDL